jgi:hypothetical protein
MKIKSIFVSGIAVIATALSLATVSTVEAQQDCYGSTYKCGYGQTWTCCNNGDRCCAYTGTDNQTWYTCRLSNQACP